MSRIGFTASLAPQDPNAIRLRPDTSRRLTALVSSGYDPDEFSTKLESHLDKATAKLLKQEQKINSLLKENKILEEMIGIEKHKVFIICAIFSISFLANIILLINK